MSSMCMRRGLVLSTAVAAAIAAQRCARGDVDVFQVLAGPSSTVPSSSNNLAAYTYNSAPGVDTAYTTSSLANGTFRQILNVTGTQSASDLVTQTPYQLFLRDGDPNLQELTPLASGMLLNPQPLTIGTTTYPANSIAIVADTGQTKTASGTIVDASTKRIYLWNLQAPTPGGNGRDEFTSIMTRAQLSAAANLGASPGNDNMGSRQFAFSSDGQSIYFTDGTAGWGGLYRLNLTNSAVTLVETERGTSKFNAEPAVRGLGNGVDRIYVDGATGIGNPGGVDYVDYDGTNATAHALVDATALKTFLNTTATLSIGAVAVDPTSSDIYFSVTGGTTADGSRCAALLRYDAQGRLSKVTDYNEQLAYYVGGGKGNPTAGTTKLQPRTIQLTGPAGNFSATQILYAETSTVKSIAGITAYRPGDFNRDGLLNQQDVALFDTPSVIQPRGTITTNSSLFKFDMNADAVAGTATSTPNAIIDYADVKVFQQFYGFLNGDANMDGTVNALDFNAVASNFGSSGMVWPEGDFNGDNVVNTLDFAYIAQNFGMTSAPPSGASLSVAALGASVPEPASIGLATCVGVTIIRRPLRRRR